MGVAEIALFLKERTDLRGGGVVVGAGGAEVGANALHHLRLHFIRPGLEQLLHPALDLLGARHVIEQPLQVGGHQNVHGGRGGAVEGTAGIVDAGGKELGEHVVFVGRADQSAHGQTHLLCVPAGENVAEVAGGHAEIRLLPHLERAGTHQLAVGVEVVDDLRHEPAPVDGVGAGKLHAPLGQLLCHVRVAKDPLHAGLGVVKIALYRIDGHILTLLSGHLQALDFAGAVAGIKHSDGDARHVAIACKGCFAGVAGSGHQDGGGGGVAQHALGLHQKAGHQLKGEVLEGAGGAVPQFQAVHPVPGFAQRRGALAEGFAVDLTHGFAQESGIIVGEEFFQNESRQRRIVRLAQCFLQIHRRELFRHEQAAVAGKAEADGPGRADRLALAASGFKLHHDSPSIFPAPSKFKGAADTVYQQPAARCGRDLYHIEADGMLRQAGLLQKALGCKDDAPLFGRAHRSGCGAAAGLAAGFYLRDDHRLSVQQHKVQLSHAGTVVMGQKPAAPVKIIPGRGGLAFLAKRLRVHRW